MKTVALTLQEAFGEDAEFIDGLSDKAKEIMSLLSGPDIIFYITEYNTETYDVLIDNLLRNMTEGYEHDEFRHQIIKYKFHKYDENEEVKYMKFNHFIVNLIFWRPMIHLDPDNLNEELIISEGDMSKISTKFIKNYMDRNYTFKYNRHIPSQPNLMMEEINHKFNEIFCDTNYNLCKISSMFLMFHGLSVNLEAFDDLAKRYPEFNEIMNYKVDETHQPIEIEQELKLAQQRMYQIINEDDYPNMLKPLIQPGAGTKNKQFKDLAVNIGLKPDEDGNTISTPINTNYLSQGGIRTAYHYYINAISGRKAAIMNKEFMGKVGHLLILCAILSARGSKLSRTEFDCNTVNPIPFEIKTEEHLNKLNGRRYRFSTQKEYSVINSYKDKHLIGQTVYVRSPITCACKNGICRECYGDLYYVNVGLNNPGIFSATIYMNPILQGILSAKHHQGTNSSRILFREEFNKFFMISSTDIILANEIDDILSYSLLIRKEWIQSAVGDDSVDDIDFAKKNKKKKKKKAMNAPIDEDDMNIVEDLGVDIDDDTEFELTLPYYTTKFEVVKYIKSKDPSNIERIEFEDHESKELFIHGDFISKMTPGEDENGKYLYIELSDINPEEFIFVIDVQNDELTKPMKSIQQALNNDNHGGCSTYEELANMLLDLSIESELAAMSVHGEMMIRQLVVDAKNILKRPNFERIIMQRDYNLLTIQTALKKNPSITTSLSTPYLKAQLVDLAETYEKTEPGILDPLFYRNIKDLASYRD